MEVLSQKVPLLSPLKDKMHRKISATKFDKTTRYDLHILLDSLPKHDKLLHGDFNPANVIVSPRRQKIHHRLGARYAGQCPLRRGENVPFVQTGRQGRPCGRIFETLFGKDGIAKVLVQKALPIVAASQTMKAIPEEQAFLEKCVNVVDYE